MRLIVLSLGLAGLVSAAQQKQAQWQEARVVAQERVNSGAEARQPKGFSMGPGSPDGVQVVLIVDSYVTIETSGAQLKLVEDRTTGGLFPKRVIPLIAPVNGTVKYTRDGDRFTLLDSEGRQHKFSLVSDTRTSAPSSVAPAQPLMSRIEDRLLEPEFGYQQYRTGVPSWQAAKEVNDAMATLRAVHPDLDQMTGLMRVVMESIRPNWKGINVDEYLESLYAVSKYAGFSVAAREALAQHEKAASQGK
ncbi:MAG: hypothetical protein ACLQBJ_04070 [Bryobacteraceae bacterium]